MNESIRLRAHGCKCDGSGLLGPNKLRCLCLDESADGALSRVTAERDQLRGHNEVLEKMLLETREALAVATADKERLIAQRVRLLEHVEERAAACQQALNLDGAQLLMAVVKEMADG